MTNKIAVIFIFLFALSVGIIVYLLTRPAPTPPPDKTEQLKYQAMYDSVKAKNVLIDDSLVKLNLKLNEIKGRDTVLIVKYVKAREIARGADEQTLDSIIKSYAR